MTSKRPNVYWWEYIIRWKYDYFNQFAYSQVQTWTDTTDNPLRRFHSLLHDVILTKPPAGSSRRLHSFLQDTSPQLSSWFWWPPLLNVLCQFGSTLSITRARRRFTFPLILYCLKQSVEGLCAMQYPFANNCSVSTNAKTRLLNYCV